MCTGAPSTWTAQAPHIHVSTVHYRVERVETLTGRDLSRLDDRVDLSAALLCRWSRPVTAGRCARWSTSPAPSP
ncbi:helix-turn-helix domain-containing protein [Streptomyces sp. NPDC088553]|uniref:helix-turn-helix domain-containing protein n=1 Tax=Streptomyces sp. NPDC088553 TaxID=3365864 RepID=UPI0037FB91A9